MASTSKSGAFAPHDHDECVASALAAAYRICEQRKLRLTPARQRVLEILLESHCAIGAYEVLARLKEEGLGSQPPIAYRALDFLVENGLAHRVERLNAFVACAHPGDGHDPTFMICRGCRKVSETHAPSATEALDAASRAGFDVEATTVEVLGLCPACQPPADPSEPGHG